MRKSEAEMLLDHLKDTYEGPLKLEVWDLQRRGHPFNLPNLEHPYFVVGIRPENDRGSVPMKTEKTTKQVLVWNAEGERISIKSTHCRKLTAQLELSESDIYIYDTRRKEFVPPEQFRLPPHSS